jgi:hypothetical protein
MSVIFCDSWDHYSEITEKWNTKGDNAINDVFPARTGTRSLQILSSSEGPKKFFGVNYSRVIAQTAFYIDNCGPGQLCGVLYLLTIPPVGDFGWIRVAAGNDKSLGIWRGGPQEAFKTELIRTRRALVLNAWNYIEFDVTSSDTNGEAVLNVNGRQLAHLTGIRTTPVLGAEYINGGQLYGPPTNANNALHDDSLFIDPSSGSITGFIPQPKIYMTVPDANSTPLQWTPSAGTNFQNVDSIPPVDSPFNSSSTIGDIDQYSHPLPTMPAAAVIEETQHCIRLAVDSGDRKISDAFRGAVGTEFDITSATPSIKTDIVGDLLQTDFPISAGAKVTG